MLPQPSITSLPQKQKKKQDLHGRGICSLRSMHRIVTLRLNFPSKKNQPVNRSEQIVGKCKRFSRLQYLGQYCSSTLL